MFTSIFIFYFRNGTILSSHTVLDFIAVVFANNKMWKKLQMWVEKAPNVELINFTRNQDNPMKVEKAF